MKHGISFIKFKDWWKSNKKLNIRAEVVADKQLTDLVTNKTLKLFEGLDIQTNFLQTDPSTLNTYEEFLSGKKNRIFKNCK